MKGEFMEEKKEEKAPVNTGTESKLVKIFRRILVTVFSLGMIVLIYKMLIHRFG
jgi:cell division septal protein FtsQ